MSQTSKTSFAELLFIFWIFLAIITGFLIGYYVPNASVSLLYFEWMGISAPICICLLLMMYPVFCKIEFEKISLIIKQQNFKLKLLIMLITNWIIAPLLMVALAWIFVFDLPKVRTALILIGVARCIAMVVVWNDLANGDAEWCTIIVTINSILQMVLYAPMSFAFVVYLSNSTMNSHMEFLFVFENVLLFLGVPFCAGLFTRFLILKICPAKIDSFMKVISPLSQIGLLATILFIFMIQAKNASENIIPVARAIPPMALYFIITFFSIFFICKRKEMSYSETCAFSLTAASNNFELAIAVSIASFGINSLEAVITVVGPLIEIPIMVLFVQFCKFMESSFVLNNV